MQTVQNPGIMLVGIAGSRTDTLLKRHVFLCVKRSRLACCGVVWMRPLKLHYGVLYSYATHHDICQHSYSATWANSTRSGICTQG